MSFPNHVGVHQTSLWPSSRLPAPPPNPWNMHWRAFASGHLCHGCRHVCTLPHMGILLRPFFFPAMAIASTDKHCQKKYNIQPRTSSCTTVASPQSAQYLNAQSDTQCSIYLCFCLSFLPSSLPPSFLLSFVLLFLLIWTKVSLCSPEAPVPPL